MLSFEQFMDRVDLTYYENLFKMRYGQALMNQLYVFYPEKYKEISGGDYDCFYDDGTVRFTLIHLEKEWKTKP